MAYSGIGGQAVIEGVMMKNKDRYSVAVRKTDGEIEIMRKPSQSLRDKNKFFDLPIIRGVVTFIESFTVGMTALNYSASFFEEEEEKEEKNAGKKDGIIMGIITVLSVVIAIGLFVLAPFFIMEACKRIIPSEMLRGFIEGVIRVVLFIIYVKAISLVKDIKRLFMYHGAEHKSINCIENGCELNIENVKKQSTEHRRCGTSFLLFVMVVSILFFMFIVIGQMWLRMLLRILLIPVIAGLSYELIRFLGSHEGKVVYVISRPGMWLQKLTTKEPDDDMIEVAIASVNAVFDWKEFLDSQANDDKKETDAEVPEEIEKKTETDEKTETAREIAEAAKEVETEIKEEIEEINKIEEDEEVEIEDFDDLEETGETEKAEETESEEDDK
ncbi:MAG: DUF1385 domain-containing protein [Eubacterium sp.]|nr:DUF1385 domain-containing protein [Eubacterium sp.]